MKKILIIGELNQVMSSVNKALSARFQTQICTDTYGVVKGMVKLFAPDMVLICLVGVGEFDNKIIDIFCEANCQIPIVFVGTTEECKPYQKEYDNPQVDYIIRPTTLASITKKCLGMLRITDEQPEVKTQRQETSSEKKNILAVDDSGILLRSVKSMLENRYDVAVATSGKMAIKQAKKKKPDLILLDYEMPEWDGKRTLEEIRADEELKDIPVVFLTAIAEKSYITAVLGLRPSSYLLKPIEQDKLIDTIEKVLTGTL